MSYLNEGLNSNKLRSVELQHFLLILALKFNTFCYFILVKAANDREMPFQTSKHIRISLSKLTESAFLYGH